MSKSTNPFIYRLSLAAHSTPFGLSKSFLPMSECQSKSAFKFCKYMIYPLTTYIKSFGIGGNFLHTSTNYYLYKYKSIRVV